MDKPAQASAEKIFKKSMAILTALIFGATLTAVACIQPSGGHVLQLQWSWFAIFWGAAGYSVLILFWQQLWRTELSRTLADKRRLILLGSIVGCLALAALIYPLRFVPKEHLIAVLFGLFSAAVVLTLIGFVIHKLIKFLSDDEPEDGEVFRGQHSARE